jgi:hypothetical protein
MDENLRRLEREAEDPYSQDKLLAAKIRARLIPEELLRVAACLRHPIAVTLYPDDVGGPGDGDRPTLDSEGMVVHCAGAAQLGDDIQSLINHLPYDRMANILLTIVTKVLADIEMKYAGSHEQPEGYVFLPEVQDLLQNAWGMISAGFDSTNYVGSVFPWEETRAMMRQLRLRAATIGTWPHQHGLTGRERSFCTALDRALTVANVFFEIAIGGGDQYRSMLGIKAFLREVCRFDPDVIDTWGMGDAILKSHHRRHRRNPDVDLRALERNWKNSGSSEDFARYATALYRAGRLWDENLPAQDLENWMITPGSPLRIEIENIADELRRSTPDGIALETLATSYPYTVGRGEGIRIFMLIARGKSFGSGYTGRAGVQITITTDGEKHLRIADETTIARYQIKEWASSIYNQLPKDWQITIAPSASARRNSYRRNSDAGLRELERQWRGGGYQELCAYNIALMRARQDPITISASEFNMAFDARFGNWQTSPMDLTPIRKFSMPTPGEHLGWLPESIVGNEPSFPQMDVYEAKRNLLYDDYISSDTLLSLFDDAIEFAKCLGWVSVKSYVKINLRRPDEYLVESWLFGREPGHFTTQESIDQHFNLDNLTARINKENEANEPPYVMSEDDKEEAMEAHQIMSQELERARLNQKVYFFPWTVLHPTGSINPENATGRGYTMLADFPKHYGGNDYVVLFQIHRAPDSPQARFVTWSCSNISGGCDSGDYSRNYEEAVEGYLKRLLGIRYM